MQKPLIGILPQYISETDRIALVADYMRAVLKAGGIPSILPLYANASDRKRMIEAYDGFLFPGGPDLSPQYYEEEACSACGNILPERDSLEISFLAELARKQKPVLGICRGIQMMNVALGGTLFQDIASQYPDHSPGHISGKMEIGHYQKAGDRVLTHLVHVQGRTRLYEMVQRDTFWVNSFHHQACKDIGKGILVSATATDGIVEAIELAGHPFFVGLQWHAEHLYAEHSPSFRIWKAFVDAARKNDN